MRLYSTSSRNVFKAKPPIGIYQEEKPTQQLGLLGMRLGESFQRLSRHINFYFKQKDLCIAPSDGSSGLVCTLQEPQRRQQRRMLSQRAVKDRRPLEESRSNLRSEAVLETAEKQIEEQTPSRLYTGLQLFHMSSLSTKFGESYTYVANHINSAFSKSPAEDIHAKTAVDESQYGQARHGRRRKTVKVIPDSQPLVNDVVKMSAQKEDSEDAKVPRSWEEGYLQFAHHINHYFGAKVTDTGSSATTYQNIRSSTESKQSPPPPQPKSPGLFHTSNITTSFGANHATMANHINHYFKGHPGFEDDLEGDYTDHTALTVTSAPKDKPASFMQYLLHSTSAIPDLIGNYLGAGSKSQEAQDSSRATPTGARLQRLVSHIP